MANYANLLAAIAANIYTNGNNEVTAAMVKSVVDAMVVSLGAGYQFMGVADPSTDPGTPDQRVFYLAPSGSYPLFGVGGLQVGNKLAALIYDSAWTIEPIMDEEMMLSTGVQDGSSWFFRDLYFESGKTYMVKLLQGEGDGYKISVGSSLSANRLKTGEWVEISVASTGTPYVFISGGSFVDAPVIEVYDKADYLISSYLMPMLEEITKQARLLQDIYIIKSAATLPAGSTTWWFYDMEMQSGKTYRVRLLSGNVDGKPIGIGNNVQSPVLSMGNWVTITATATGNPFIYIGPGGDFSVPPVIEIAEESNVLIPMSHVINVSRDGTSKTGRTIHFSGLNAIEDALNSITDASEINRYTIHVEGEFHFTDPLDLNMTESDSPTSERSVIVMKPFVDIEGDGPDKSIIFVDFPAGATFHTDLDFDDYQPVYFSSSGGNMRRMKVAGKNCRYTVHIDSLVNAQKATDAEINIEDCEIVSYGAPDYRPAGEMDCFGTGIYNGQVWHFKGCDILNYRDGGNAFAVHPPLAYQVDGTRIVFENCTFRGNIRLHNYQVSNFNYVEFIGCTFTKGAVPQMGYPYYNNNVHGGLGLYTSMLAKGNKLEALFNADNLTQNDGKGCVLRVTSLSTGVGSTVRFSESPAAFNTIIGNSANSAQLKTIYGWDTIFGYVFRDGGVDLHGVAFGTLDIDEHSAGGNTLGKRLGDCTIYTKTLVIYIDGTSYSVVFNENYTAKNNAYVIAAINAVIGAVATADVYCPANLYYPTINGLTEAVSADPGAILKGMGVVFSGSGMRRAKNTDGYIDGICIDDTSLGQIGRVITRGYIYSARTWRYASAYDRPAVHISAGDVFGIDPNTDGQFTANASPAVLICKETDILKII